MEEEEEEERGREGGRRKRGRGRERSTTIQIFDFGSSCCDQGIFRVDSFKTILCTIAMF